ncbi:MAG: hypothetical protein EA374_07135 [Acholeplasmatales bacterium]|nr:MAG: hypothetical protein EA374_07135 [Acholeplasmatales bacterium]
MTRIILGILFVLSVLTLLACEPSSAPQDDAIRLLEGAALDTSEHVLWLGRSYYDDATSTRHITHATGGFSVTFSGTRLTMTMVATQTHDTSRRPYFTVVINDPSLDEGRVFSLDTPTSTVVLAEGLPEGTHTVTLYKRSESQDATTALKQLETDGTFLKPARTHALNILALGGSGMSGNGVFGAAGIARTTENSSALHAFAFQTALALDAHMHLVAGSGFGLKWGYNPGGQTGTVNIRNAFDVMGINEDRSLSLKPFAPMAFIPDVILFNLGGNDFSAYVLTRSGQERLDAEDAFQEAVIEIITTMRTLYPEAIMFWTHTGSLNGTLAANVIADLDPLKTFIEVVVIHSPGAFGDPVGSGNHAGEQTHARNAALLVERMRDRLD